VEKIQLQVLGLAQGQVSNQSYALILSEIGGARRLPIIIGATEAQSIALQMEGLQAQRPNAHDLTVTILKDFHLRVIEVLISQLIEGVFYASLVIESPEGIHTYDARPSDAIAIAIRFGADIFINAEVLQEAGIEIETNEDEDDSDEHEDSEELVAPRSAATRSGGADLTSVEVRIKALTDRIQKAIENEDYEQAARLRDELNKLQS
jgi:bifunctional DNase/RNase